LTEFLSRDTEGYRRRDEGWVGVPEMEVVWVASRETLGQRGGRREINYRTG
jgi:hypothetical protein